MGLVAAVGQVGVHEAAAWVKVFAGHLGHALLGAGVVDEFLVGGVGGDKGATSQVVEGAGEAVGGLVKAGDGVVGEQGLSAAGDGEVVLQVGR